MKIKKMFAIGALAASLIGCSNISKYEDQIRLRYKHDVLDKDIIRYIKNDGFKEKRILEVKNYDKKQKKGYASVETYYKKWFSKYKDAKFIQYLSFTADGKYVDKINCDKFAAIGEGDHHFFYVGKNKDSLENTLDNFKSDYTEWKARNDVYDLSCMRWEDKKKKQISFFWEYNLGAFMKRPGSLLGIIHFLMNTDIDHNVQLKNQNLARVGIQYNTESLEGDVSHYYYVVEEYVKDNGNWKFRKEKDRFRCDIQVPFGARDPKYKAELKGNHTGGGALDYILGRF